MNTENNKTSEPHRFKLDWTDKLNLKDPKKNMALANLNIYYTSKNIKSECSNNKFAIATTEVNTANVLDVKPAANVSATIATFQIIDTKSYVSVVTLSKENEKKLLQQLKSGSKRTVKWNKYRSQMTSQSNNNNLVYLIDPPFNKVNRMFVLLFEKFEENNVEKDHRDSFSCYCVPNVDIKDLAGKKWRRNLGENYWDE